MGARLTAVLFIIYFMNLTHRSGAIPLEPGASEGLAGVLQVEVEDCST
jgi:hypothetical protein